MKGKVKSLLLKISSATMAWIFFCHYSRIKKSKTSTFLWVKKRSGLVICTNRTFLRKVSSICCSVANGLPVGLTKSHDLYLKIICLHHTPISALKEKLHHPILINTNINCKLSITYLLKLGTIGYISQIQKFCIFTLLGSCLFQNVVV